MVTLTRLTGARFALNPDLIERVDRTPDTVITLVDGTKYLVRESLDDRVEAIRHNRAPVRAAAGALDRVGDQQVRRGRLAAVPTLDESDDPVLPLGPRQG
jgi:flagellar protein FlbD